MALKLKSISNRIHWSLVSKAFVVLLVWFLTHTFWIFAFVALFVYFVPLFRPFDVIVPFLATLILAAMLPKMALTAIFFGLLFYLILGIKDLIFINREGAYQLLVVLLWFAATGLFFPNFHSFEYPSAIIVIALVYFFLVRNLMSYVLGSRGGHGGHARREIFGIVGIGGLLIAEFAWALLFLPFPPLHQAAILFLAGAVFVEFLLEYTRGKLERSMMVMNSSVLIGFLMLILFVTQWRL